MITFDGRPPARTASLGVGHKDAVAASFKDLCHSVADDLFIKSTRVGSHAAEKLFPCRFVPLDVDTGIIIRIEANAEVIIPKLLHGCL